MSKIFKLLFNRWVLAIIGLLAIGLLIWFLGPLIAIAEFRPLEPELSRIVLIGLIVLIYAGRLVWRLIKSHQSNARLMQGLTKQAAAAAPAGQDASAQEVATLQQRFEEAVAILKQTKKAGGGLRALLPGRHYLYELPWYIFIGAPGSGKTTALVNSGLQFPLVERFGQQKIRGVGGTRNCDWWFTDEAVLLDTAGRYTTQESNRNIDSAAWGGFLQLLKKYRPRRPINGVIVTISVADLLQQTSGQIEAQAGAVRARIQELHDTLGIRFPVYVLVTKADLLPGFMEFFGEYGREERAQVWGVSFPLSDKDAAPLAHLASELQALEKRLNERLVDQLQRERDLQKRSLLYTFPQHFSAIKEPLSEFLALALGPTRFEIQPMVRGVYLTSGTQEGSPIDRILGQLARALHLEHRLLPPQRSSGKAYFITRLIKDVIFAEAGLAGTNLRWERRRATLHWVSLALAAMISVGAIVAWTISYTRNKAYIAEIETKIQAVSKRVGGLDARGSSDIVGLLPILQAVRDIGNTSAVGADDAPLSMRFGLYQGDKLRAAANAAYRRLLQDAFLPRWQAGIEERLRTRGQTNPELLYEALKAYIMLSDPQHFDSEALKAFVTADWESSLPRDITTEQRRDLAVHLDTLLSAGATASPVLADRQLIASTRDALSRTPIAQRIYNRLKRLEIGASLPAFTVAGVAGPSAPLVFVRASGQPLTNGIPGLFSVDGYRKTFVSAAERVSKQLADEESWVLGLKSKEQSRFTDTEGLGHLFDDVRQLYLKDYARNWEEFIGDIRLRRANSLQDAIQYARILSAPDSPLPILLRAIVKEVTLVKTADAEKDLIDKATDKVRKTRDDMVKLLGQRSTAAPTLTEVSRPEHIVDDRFDALRRLVRVPAPGQPAPIDATLGLINDLYVLLTATEAAIRGGNPPPPSDIATKIKAEAGRLPEPLRSMLTTLSQAGQNQALGATRANISQAITAGISDFCVKAIAGRYPFERSSNRDVTPDDFGRLFAPGGLMDEFFQKNLAPYVDTTGRPWKFRQIGDATMGHSSATLLEFQRAQAIRDVFFRSGGRGASMQLEFKPLEMDASITQLILDVDGQLVKYSHGPQVPMTVKWPGPRGSTQVRLQLSPPSAAGTSGQVFEGPWALFRMLDRARVESTGQPEKFVVSFSLDGRKAQFEVTTNSVSNPFRLPELAQFRCPERL